MRSRSKMSERELLKTEAGKCELCGSTRNLEIHHIIPMACSNEYIDLDVEDNWVCLCGACHAKLTPKNMLTRLGIANAKRRNDLIKAENIRQEMFTSIFKRIDDELPLSSTELLDVLLDIKNEWMLKTI